jgi:hypothetical protein
MNAPKSSSGHEPSRDEMMSALFAHLVMQQSNMAMMLMGKTPHPETGKAVRDLESAKLFIDLLEMLETRTKGNLSKEEQNLLKQTLMAVRMAFVEAVESPSTQSEAKPQDAGKSAEPEKAPSLESAPPAAEESHKKFTKKY